MQVAHLVCVIIVIMGNNNVTMKISKMLKKCNNELIITCYANMEQ